MFIYLFLITSRHTNKKIKKSFSDNFLNFSSHSLKNFIFFSQLTHRRHLFFTLTDYFIYLFFTHNKKKNEEKNLKKFSHKSYENEKQKKIFFVPQILFFTKIENFIFFREFLSIFFCIFFILLADGKKVGNFQKRKFFFLLCEKLLYKKIFICCEIFHIFHFQLFFKKIHKNFNFDHKKIFFFKNLKIFFPFGN